MRKWTEEEDQFLRKCSDKGVKYVSQSLNRTIGSVKNRARKLNVRFSTREFWTQEQKEYLKNNYHKVKTSDIASHIGKTLTAVYGACERIGIRITQLPRQKATVDGNVCIIPLHSRRYPNAVAFADADMIDIINRYRWHILKSSTGVLYAKARQPNTKPPRYIFMHNLVTGKSNVDHKDHNGLNNKRGNLRPCTRSENLAGQLRKHGKSKFIGVCYEKRTNKWRAYVTKDKKQYSAGNFTSEIDAAKARDQLAKRLHSQFATLNFPEED